MSSDSGVPPVTPPAIPEAIAQDIAKARRLEIWTLLWTGSIVLVMGLVMGSSQAMKSAWIEDVLSLVPAIVFLIALHFEKREPNQKFRFGYRRVNSLAFLIAAVTLTGVGGFLLFEAAKTLLMQEHPTIGPITIFGHTIWLGWLMIAALLYSVIPPVILGYMKHPIAEKIQDKVLHTDALMQKADWMTGLAGIVGVMGVGLGYWWADAVAAGFISFEILRDGIKNLRIATAELIDGMPRELENDDIADDALELEQALLRQYPDAKIQMRESGRYILVQIGNISVDEWRGIDSNVLPERQWRVDQISLKCPTEAER
ncbi:cation diffusion facilitator family transporter [Parasphingorhabdus sp.]|uniref:cation diffusion facilitator family transporter n=1 Tax=Parasphingorhabdus sp. TaxID=2709688 RepID=UPI002F921F8B